MQFAESDVVSIQFSLEMEKGKLEDGEEERGREKKDGENETQHAKVFHIICMEDELESVFILP